MDSLIFEIKELLKGIDKETSCDINGWWETSIGAEFGTKKLQQLIDLINNHS
jgi:hypothetical protein